MDIPVYGYVFSFDKEVNCKLETNAGSISHGKFKQHWIVVTEIHVDNISGKIECVFSTWGKKGVIDYETYYSMFNFYCLNVV